MTERDLGGEWVPPPLDGTRPSVARMYDYYLGGKDNFAIDRAAAEQVLAVVPELRDACEANRRFLADAVREMAAAGVRQFLDLGTGIPAGPGVHETARQVHPGAAVVYVDNDPVVVAHNRALRRADGTVVAVAADLRDPAAVLAGDQVRRALDLSHPLGVLLVAVLHFVEVSLGPRIVARYLRDLPPGSMVAVTAATSEGVPASVRRRVESIYAATSAPFVYRTRAQFEELLGPLAVRPPGVRQLARTPTLCLLGAVAVKR